MKLLKEVVVAGDAEQNATNNHLAPPPPRRRCDSMASPPSASIWGNASILHSFDWLCKPPGKTDRDVDAIHLVVQARPCTSGAGVEHSMAKKNKVATEDDVGGIGDYGNKVIYG